MRGRNLFDSYQRSGSIKLTTGPCVFISHNSKDKPMARAVATAVKDMGIDIYFDEHDVALRSASALGDDKAIVNCIEDGLDKSTHLIGLITRHTFESWWVPYEIGSASGRNAECGHLVAYNVDRLPSYVKVAPVWLDIDDLTNWISKQVSRSKEVIMEEMAPVTKSALKQYVPDYRTTKNIKYY